jgi:polyribonucleotide nucleotidyltransferase
MFNEIIKSIDWAGDKLVLKTGKIARQADGAVLAELGKTQVLCVVSGNPKIKKDADFFALSVHYREMTFSAGKIPGGFFKREGKASEKEVLTSRLIDRAIRPLFPENFLNETQIICTVLSHDTNHSSDIVAMIGAYAAVAISGLPLLDLIAASRVGFIDEKFVLNPSMEQLKKSRLDLVMAATSSSVMMVESESQELSYDLMLEAIEFGHKSLQPVIQLIKELQNETAKQKWLVEPQDLKDIEEYITKNFDKQTQEALELVGKHSKEEALLQIHAQILDNLKEQHSENLISENLIYLAFENVKARILRNWILDLGKRIDGRKLDEIRSINCEVSLLAKTHGSALFTRGETQALAVTTLGSSHDEQMVETLDKETKEHFMLHYIFPPYSVNETSPFRAPGRREIGHGKLAWRAINPVMPSKESFPYTVRSVSEITESNGSSSMATVCGVVLSMLDAGVPLKTPVAGIAMGLIKEGDKFAILSDIIAAEDYLGDMDFKVAGTKDGVTALQMDIKIHGITANIMKVALTQAQKGVSHILSIMNSTLAAPRSEINQYAPLIKTIKIAKDKIKDVIGPGGKMIKEICEVTGAKIDISDDGTVKVFGVGSTSVQAAVDKILSLGAEPEMGTIYDAQVIKILEIGIIIKFFGNKESLIHVNDIFISKGQDINSYFKIGDSLPIKFIGYDSKKRYRVTMKVGSSSSDNADQEKANYQVVSEKKYFS